MPSWDELSREIFSGRLPPVGDSPKVLRAATGQFLTIMYTDPQWDHVSNTLEQLAVDNSIDGILLRTREAMAGIQNSLIQYCRTSPGPEQSGSLETELAQAEADLRERLPEIATKLPQVEKATEDIVANPQTRKAVERISAAVKNTTASKLSPVGLLVMLWWLFVVAFPTSAANEVAVLALWYTVARDVWKKGD
jgi:hypothetical protein